MKITQKIGKSWNSFYFCYKLLSLCEFIHKIRSSAVIIPTQMTL